jgi:predicted ArsR family transcriptional regulator
VKRFKGEAAFIAALELKEWTIRDLAASLGIGVTCARRHLARLATWQLVFCRTDRAQVYRPKVYRVLPRAVSVRVVQRVKVKAA